MRVRMAAEAGANVIVTACPFCMVNIEDAIKVAGLEGKMTAIDYDGIGRSAVRVERAVGSAGEFVEPPTRAECQPALTKE